MPPFLNVKTVCLQEQQAALARLVRDISIYPLLVPPVHMSNQAASQAADSSRHGSQSDLAHYCGPYKLDKTLGKGQTGTLVFLLFVNVLNSVL
jgi:uncharacterized membrane protein